MVDQPKVSRDAGVSSRRSQVEVKLAPKGAASDEGLGVRTLITRARSALLSSFDTALERYGVTGAQFEVLKTLYRNTVETSASLCRTLHYDTGSMTRMLDRLEEKRLVKRQRDERDRRVMLLRLTEPGERLMPRLRSAAKRALDRHLVGFTPREIDNLKDYLGRIIGNGRRQDGASFAEANPGRSKGAVR